MTNDDRTLLDELKNNIMRLFQTVDEIGISNRKLAEEVTALKSEICSLKNENEVLSKKNENLRIANLMLAGTDESKLARNKINKVVREIDKCIALLNR